MDRDRCPCGGVIFADTEDWEIPFCYNCYTLREIGKMKLKNWPSDEHLAHLIYGPNPLLEAHKKEREGE